MLIFPIYLVIPSPCYQTVPRPPPNNKHLEKFLVLGGTQYEGAKLPQILNQ